MLVDLGQRHLNTLRSICESGYRDGKNASYQRLERMFSLKHVHKPYLLLPCLVLTLQKHYVMKRVP
jgi:hypothetical protein